MKKTQETLYALYMLFGVSLVTANAISSKVFALPIYILGQQVTMTVGAICYPITFLVTDIIGELWGKKEASAAVKTGFFCQVFSTAIILIGRLLPAVSADVQQSYVSILSQSWIFVIASLAGFIVSQKFDVFVFHSIRDTYIRKHGSTKGGKWIWNNVGTISSQLFDTVIFAFIAFGLGFGWINTSEGRKALVAMIIGQWVFKSIIALLDTPVFYLCTRGSK